MCRYSQLSMNFRIGLKPTASRIVGDFIVSPVRECGDYLDAHHFVIRFIVVAHSNPEINDYRHAINADAILPVLWHENFLKALKNCSWVFLPIVTLIFM